jgi:alpha-galactosidase
MHFSSRRTLVPLFFLILPLAAASFLKVRGDNPTTNATPAAATAPDPFEILTPPVPDTPRINGPKIFGVRPGSPFVYAVPVSGKRPIAYAAQNLPAGLQIDAATGVITGVLKSTGTFDVTLQAKNDLGSAEKKFRIVVGDDLALTPPMGWSSWNCFLGGITQKKILGIAHGLVDAHLNDHGFVYINTDDCWQGTRGGPNNALQASPKTFPDIKAMVEEIHGLHLKAGIYSTPWVTSYDDHNGGSSQTPDGAWDSKTMTKGPKNKKVFPFAIGQYHFAKQDAQQWADWGFDYLKYDWNPNEVPETKEMADALRATGRDIVYSLSNNSGNPLFAHIGEISPLANLWRISDDIRDTWLNLNRNAFNKDRWAPFNKPGHYNDPDMMVVGVVFGHPSRLTSNEQYTHVSLWCLMSSPLILGCDTTKLDAFTLGLLTNDEVLDIDQDTLCQQATVVAKQGDTLVYRKQLDDGSIAIGLFNVGPTKTTVTANWSDLKLSGKQVVRDLWRQKDLGTYDTTYSAEVESHGVALLKLTPAP